MSHDTITRAELKVLEKMFEAEIDHAMRKIKLPYCYQSKSKLLPALEEKRLIERVKFTLGGRFAMEIEGWALTHSGRFTYCANC